MPDDTLADIRQAQGHRLNDRAMALHARGAPAATTITMLRRACSLMPDNAMVWSNIGLILWCDWDIEQARAAFDKAIRLDPENHIYHGNAGVLCSSTGNSEAAEVYLAEAIRLNPDSLSARWDRSLLHLWTGDWERGLVEYDIRRQHRGPSLYPSMPVPMWNGEDLNGKTLYIQGEQGVGDRIFFSRYIAWVKDEYPDCRILVCMNDELTNLLWEFRSVAEFLPQGIPWPANIDYAAFLCSLPTYHRSTRICFPPDPGLIKRRIDTEKTKVSLPEPQIPSLRVAICWTGNPEQTRNSERSIPLEHILPIAEDPRIMLYSVQVGSDDLQRMGAEDLVKDLGPEIKKEGWVGTALVLREVDVVVTVCTAVAHLAGAIGAHCWTILCKDPYWIWPREGDSTPWYPGMKLFRQKTTGDWRDVMAEVRLELSNLADERLRDI